MDAIAVRGRSPAVLAFLSAVMMHRRRAPAEALQRAPLRGSYTAGQCGPGGGGGERRERRERRPTTTAAAAMGAARRGGLSRLHGAAPPPARRRRVGARARGHRRAERGGSRVGDRRRDRRDEPVHAARNAAVAAGGGGRVAPPRPEPRRRRPHRLARLRRGGGRLPSPPAAPLAPLGPHDGAHAQALARPADLLRARGRRSRSVPLTYHSTTTRSRPPSRPRRGRRAPLLRAAVVAAAGALPHLAGRRAAVQADRGLELAASFKAKSAKGANEGQLRSWLKKWAAKPLLWFDRTYQRLNKLDDPAAAALRPQGARRPPAGARAEGAIDAVVGALRGDATLGGSFNCLQVSAADLEKNRERIFASGARAMGSRVPTLLVGVSLVPAAREHMRSYYREPRFLGNLLPARLRPLVEDGGGGGSSRGDGGGGDGGGGEDGGGGGGGDGARMTLAYELIEVHVCAAADEFAGNMLTPFAHAVCRERDGVLADSPSARSSSRASGAATCTAGVSPWSSSRGWAGRF